MIEVKDIYKYLLEQVQTNNFNKEYAYSILKQLNNVYSPQIQEIAIIGIGCRLTNTNSHNEYWENLQKGKCHIGTFPDIRLKDVQKYSGNPYFKTDDFFHAAFLSRIDLFDPEFFRIPPKVAEVMDPYQRLLLEVSTESIFDAGYSLHSMSGSSTGVFIGTDHTHKLRTNYLNHFKDTDLSTMTGSWTAILASRLSYVFNLAGPSIVIDTACSSSLSALNVACNSLKNGECNQAIVGGINIFLAPLSSDKAVNLTAIQSQSNIAKPFDRNAKGAIWGEAVCSIIIKPLKEAIKDNDNIYATIKSYGINNDGTTNGITAPNPKAQASLLVNTWKKANINPENIAYIEAHALGTPLGDSIEIKGISEAFREFTSKKQFCGIGSIKGNYGHTVGSSGLISIIKVALSLKNKKIPPTINFEYPNEYINFCDSPLYLVNELKEWETPNNEQRLGAVNSFSFNGTNIHVVLGEYVSSRNISTKKYNIFTLSSQDKERLILLLETYGTFVTKINPDDINNICYTQNIGRDHYDLRVSFVIESHEDFKEKIRKAIQILQSNGLSTKDIYFSDHKSKSSNKEKYQKSIELKEQLNNVEVIFSNYELLDILCRSYVSYIDIDWKPVYSQKDNYRISLPLPLFKKERYWPDKEQKTYTVVKGQTDITDKQEEIALIIAETLGFEKLNIQDNFYNLGADSISAMKIINLLNEKYNTSIPISDFLSTPKIVDFTKLIESKYLSETSIKLPSLFKASPAIDNYYITSSPQKRMYYLWHISPDTTLYNLCIGAPLYRDISTEKMQSAIHKLIDRHEVFRSYFKTINDELYQVIEENTQTKLYYEEHTGKDINEDYINSLLKSKITRFDLDKVPLYKFHLFKFSKDYFFLYLDIHHIISDGTSLNILFKELMMIYDDMELPSLEFQYKDYAAWQQKYLLSDSIRQKKEYWLNLFSDEIPVISLPTDKKRPGIQSFEGAMFHSIINSETRNKLVRLSQSNHITLNVLILSITNILLSKLSGQEDIIVGTPIAGRIHHQFDSMLGMFVNTLALRNKPEASKTFKEFIYEVRDNLFKAFDNQEYQFEDLVESLSLERDASRNPLFDVMFQMQNEEFEMELYECQRDISKFDLTFTVREENEILHFYIEYSTDLFKPETIERIFNFINLIIQQVTDNEKILLSDISVLDEKEKDKLLSNFNDTQTPYPSDKSVSQLFKQICLKYPDNVALQSDTETYTYRELDMITNRLAHRIREYIIPDDIIGIIMERSCDLIITTIAIVKAGGVYMPLDTKYPQDRMNQLLDDSGCKLVILQDKYKDAITTDIKQLIISDENVFTDNINEIPDTGTSDSLLNIMYTSGSTGNPKGVMITHRNVVRLVRNTNYLDYNEKNVFIQIAAPSFDACTFELWGALLNGGKLCIIKEEDILEPNTLHRRINEMGVNTAFFTVAFFNQIAEKYTEVFENLNTLFVGGDRVSYQLINLVRDKYPHIHVKHVYGPTENGTYSTYLDVDHKYNESIPIGKPISNSTLFILDKHLNLQPIGVPGEICLGGDGIAKGYLNKPDITNEKFIDNPFGSGKLYRSGDYGRWLPNGEVEFLGRIDHQIKIRGFRVELGEIESALIKHPDVVECVITVEDNAASSKYLVCYYRTLSGNPHSISDLKSFLADSLPEYMIPSFFAHTAKFELNKNGKVDKAKLKLINKQTIEEIVLPETETEETILNVWKEVLNVEKISVTDNFFHIGGDSIKAIQISSRLQSQGISASVNMIFQHNSIRELAPHVTKHQTSISQETVTGSVSLTPIQKWFFENQFYNNHVFHQGITLRLNTTLESDNLIQVLDALTNHHDALRMQYTIDQDGIISQYNKDVGSHVYNLSTFHLNDVNDKEQYIGNCIKDIQNQTDIRKALINVICFNDFNTSIVYIWIHHLVIDGISWRILIEDLIAAFKQLSEKKDIQFPLKSNSFKQWSERISEYAFQERYQPHVSYWEQMLQKVEVDSTDILCFNSDNASFDSSSSVRCSLDDRSTELLLKESHAAYNTEINDLLMAALTLALNKWTGKQSFLINMEGHGRENILDDLNINRTVGWFTSSFPVLLSAEGNDIAENIKITKDTLHKIPQKGIDYGIARYLSDNKELIDKLKRVSPAISYNYLGQFDMSLPDGGVSVEFLPLYTDNRNKRYYKLDINSIISQGQLHTDFGYSCEEYSETDIHTLATYFKDFLEMIISHCTNKKEQEYTLSDYTSKDIAQNELDNILDELGFD